MTRPLVLALALIALAPGVGAAPFLQYGVDAARTGASQDLGPATLDVAFNTTIDPAAEQPWASMPVILDGAVYALRGARPDDGFNEA